MSFSLPPSHSLHQLTKDKKRENNIKARLECEERGFDVLSDNDVSLFSEAVKAFYKVGDDNTVNLLIKIYEVPSKDLFLALPVDIEGDYNGEEPVIFYFDRTKLSAVAEEWFDSQRSEVESDFQFSMPNRHARYQNRIASEVEAAKVTRKIETVTNLILNSLSMMRVEEESAFTLSLNDHGNDFTVAKDRTYVTLSTEEIKRAQGVRFNVEEANEKLREVDRDMNEVKSRVETSQNALVNMETIINNLEGKLQVRRSKSLSGLDTGSTSLPPLNESLEKV
jgi:hypothetical protein